MSGGRIGTIPSFPPHDDFARNILNEDPEKVGDVLAERLAKRLDGLKVNGDGQENGTKKEPRKMRIACVGAGASGIYTAIRHQGVARGQKAVENMELVWVDLLCQQARS